MKNKKYIFGVALFLTALVCFGNDDPPPPPPPPSLPIDGGLVFLFLTAILFGIKKLRN
tara:strand:+ start:433 stop:606 length:174 start_codon:yes stop_codon:yes gene_type:complete